MRKCTAQHLANLVEKVGPFRLLSGLKDLTDRILPAVTKLAQDSSQEARYVETFCHELGFLVCFFYKLGPIHVGVQRSGFLFAQMIFSVAFIEMKQWLGLVCLLWFVEDSRPLTSKYITSDLGIKMKIENMILCKRFDVTFLLYFFVGWCIPCNLLNEFKCVIKSKLT